MPIHFLRFHLITTSFLGIATSIKRIDLFRIVKEHGFSAQFKSSKFLGFLKKFVLGKIQQTNISDANIKEPYIEGMYLKK